MSRARDLCKTLEMVLVKEKGSSGVFYRVVYLRLQWFSLVSAMTRVLVQCSVRWLALVSCALSERSTCLLDKINSTSLRRSLR